MYEMHVSDPSPAFCRNAAHLWRAGRRTSAVQERAVFPQPGPERPAGAENVPLGRT